MATNSYGTVQLSAPTSDSELCDAQLQSGQPASRQDEGSIVGNGKGFCRQSSSTEELNELKDFSFNAGLSDEKSPQQQRSTTQNCDFLVYNNPGRSCFILDAS